MASIERAQDRRTYVLRRMLELGKIDQAQHDAAMQETLSNRLHGPIIELDAPYVAEMVRADMLRQHGPEALTAGFSVTTTIDSRLQRAANAATWRTLLEYERRHGYRGPVERIAAASWAMPPRSHWCSSAIQGAAACCLPSRRPLATAVRVSCCALARPPPSSGRRCHGRVP